MKNPWQKKIPNYVLFGSIFLFYVLYIGIDLLQNNFCGNTAVDFCAYWSVGKIINENGFHPIYDLNMLEALQKQIYPSSFSISQDGQIFPFLYLPIFAIPFSFLSQIKITYSFLIYSLINIAGSIIYLQFFYKSVTGKKIDTKLLMLGVMSIPFFQNLLFGQINVLLLLFVGEFFRNYANGNEPKAGFWLAGLMLKPQTLIFILPFLLYKQKWKTLVGFVSFAVLLLALSILLVGTQGMMKLSEMLTMTSLGQNTSNPFVMTNWRMFSLLVGNYSGSDIGIAVLILGSLITVGLAILLVKRSESFGLKFSPSTLLIIFCLTMVVTWHSHLSMSILLLPLLLLVPENQLSRKFLTWYFLLPIFLFITVYFGQIFLFLDIPYTMTNNLLGLAGFTLNLLLLGYILLHPNSPKNDLEKCA